MTASDKGYHVVAPTDDERRAWVIRYGPRQAAPYRVECDRCGVRYWLSGLGVGSHQRSRTHNAAPWGPNGGAR